MYFDIFLLSVVVVTAYLGPMIVRRHPPGHRLFGWLLLADGVLALTAFLGRHSRPDGATGGADLVGFVAVAAAVCLLMVPPLLRELARRAVLSDRLGLARRFISLREHLQPGMGAERERELLDALIAVRTGQVDDAIAVLEEARGQLTDPEAARRIDERIVLTYLSARRWEDAIRVYEGALEHEVLSPQIVVEMVRAYCEVGDIESGAALVAVLETLPVSEEPVLAALLGRARLVLLAFAGSVRAVDMLLAPGGLMSTLPEAARHFWAGVARLNAGDRDGARRCLEQAVRLSRRDPLARDFAQKLIDSMDQPGVLGPRELDEGVAALVQRLASQCSVIAPPRKQVPQMSGVPWRHIPVTCALIAANLAAFFLVLGLYGSTGDPGALMRAGANVKSAVKAGEWWRLMSSTFLHVGVVHLLLNMYALWLLGKLVEQIYGPLRMFALYTSAGLLGALASAYLGGAGGISAGASGAVLGLLGALIAELGLRRRDYPERWRKLLFGNLVFVAVAQVAIGFFYPAIDQSAHVGGLLAGALVAALIAPVPARGGQSHGARAVSPASRGLTALLAVMGASMIAWGAAGVATTSYADTLARYGETEHRVGRILAFRGPAHWELADGRFRDDVEVTLLSLEIRPRGDSTVAQHVARRLRDERPPAGASPRRESEQLAVPEPWHSREMIYQQDGMGGEQTYRIIVFGREHDSEVWLGSLLVPEALAADIEPMLARLLLSMRRF